MTGLLGFISSLATTEISVRVGSAKRRAISIALVAVCALVAVGFGLAALTIWLAGLYGALNACLIVAAGFLIMALAIFVVSKMVEARARRIARRREADRALFLAAAMSAARSGFRSKTALAVAVPLAALVGIVLSGSVGGKRGDR